MEFSTLGEVFLMGDFNARTCSDLCDRYDCEDTKALHTIQEEHSVSLSTDNLPPSHTSYGRDLLALGSQYHLVIYI